MKERGIEARRNLVDLGRIYSDAGQTLNRKLSVGDDCVRRAINKISQLPLKPACCRKRYIFSMREVYDRNAEQSLQSEADDGLRIEVAAVNRIGTLSDRKSW